MIAKQKLWHHRVGLVKTRPMMCFLFNPRPCAAFYSVESVNGGFRRTPSPSRSAPDGLRALREKNDRVALNEGKPMVPNFKVSGQPMTSELRSNTRSGRPDTTTFGMI